MKVGDLVRVLLRQWDGVGYYDGQLGVIIAQTAVLGEHIMMMDGSKVWLETKRLEAVNESR